MNENSKEVLADIGEFEERYAQNTSIFSVKRIYVQKRQGYNIEEKGILNDIKQNLLIKEIEDVILLNRYDVSGITDEVLQKAKNTVFSEPQVDLCFEEEYPFEEKDIVFGVEYLPGQFDQRANSLSECLQIISGAEKPISRSAKIYILKGNISNENINKIKKYLINPVDSMECKLEKPLTLEENIEEPKQVEVLEGFIDVEEPSMLQQFKQFAMDKEDLKFCQDYFKNVEKRNPTITEMKMIDTYWSDHCRHTTFLTKLEKIDIKWEFMQEIYKEYLKSRENIYENNTKNICLMDIATIVMKELKKEGILKDLDDSEEINACSIKAEIEIYDNIDKSSPKKEEYLIMFKNETHNHPTEIEPFGGAATCLGGAIRDPLSGRSYVYQAMRVTRKW